AGEHVALRVEVCGPDLVVDPDLADAADVGGGGVGPHQVLAVGAVEALLLERGNHRGEVVDLGGAHAGGGDDHLAGRVGVEPHVAGAAGFRRRVGEDGLDVARPRLYGRKARGRVAAVRAEGGDGLDAAAGRAG